ncbi:MAG: NAD(P)H-hydrate dehydratase [Gammaproteobacteria bacterium]|nr:NAD(P)H-hydrate dehydratase [Gammaproteobacteria bacterium]
MAQIPNQLYSVTATRQLDKIAIEDFKIPGYSLMSKAGDAVFKVLQNEFPLAKRILVCCGAGNNAGDGYVVARLAHKAGLDVDLVSLTDVSKLTGDAQQAYRDWKSLGHQLSRITAELLDHVDVIVDALLGTGVDREVTGDWKKLIDQINNATTPVIAVDVPSGLNADTGDVFGVAVKADVTVSFIAQKKGLFTYMGPEYSGRLFFYDLNVPPAVYKSVVSDAALLDWDNLKTQFVKRHKNSHKGDFGHVLVIGGDYGMAGAVRLAGEAALRTGAGMVTVLTRPEHVSVITAGCPELMVVGSGKGHIPQDLLTKIQSIVIGPGLGRDSWSMNLLAQVLQTRIPKLVDADALNLLTIEDPARDDWVLTPHPGEAARLLELSSKDIQQNRFWAVDELQQQYGGVIVLKGCGSLIRYQGAVADVCPYGNPGMSTAGMGDVLSGVIGALIAQGFSLAAAARTGVCLHARAGDLAAQQGERGMKASDLFAEIRTLVNPG